MMTDLKTREEKLAAENAVHDQRMNERKEKLETKKKELNAKELDLEERANAMEIAKKENEQDMVVRMESLEKQIEILEIELLQLRHPGLFFREMSSDINSSENDDSDQSN